MRKVVLVGHVATSVGWFGAVLAYLALDLTASFGTDPAVVRAAFIAMDLTVGRAIVPLALASLAIGILNSLATPWGLFRHYWVLIKLLLTVLATAVLLVEAATVRATAAAAATGTDPTQLPGTLPHSIGGAVVLLVVLVLSVVKPRGLTRYGWGRQARVSQV